MSEAEESGGEWSGRGLRLRALGDGGFVAEVCRERDWQALVGIVDEADARGAAAAELRLFPEPVDAELESEDEFREEWHELVHGELRDRFAGDLEVVQRDVAKAVPGDGMRSIRVQPADVERWFSALNQARLVMQARHAFPEEETAESIGALLKEGKVEAYMRTRLYAAMQEWLIQALMGRS